jgi:hypothetical protein
MSYTRAVTVTCGKLDAKLLPSAAAAVPLEMPAADATTGGCTAVVVPGVDTRRVALLAAAAAASSSVVASASDTPRNSPYEFPAPADDASDNPSPSTPAGAAAAAEG